MTHEPVMRDSVMEALALQPGMVAVDGTVGLAGHASEIARRIAPGGLLIGLDWDAAMLAEARVRLQDITGVTVRLFQSDYRDLKAKLVSACVEAGRDPQADAVLLDMGLNNAQIEDEARGISFRTDAPLDMRMDRSKGEPASAALNRLSVNEIEQVLWEYGDERWARKIAQVIVERRKTKPVLTTADLVDCVLAAIPSAMRDRRIHPATRTFQAVRIFVNGELEGLQDTIIEAARCLAVHGVMVVLSYHSGEDRAVKRAFKSLLDDGYQLVNKKPIRPSAAEVASNPKSRSAMFRAIKRIH